jgi:hypothetical protein
MAGDSQTNHNTKTTKEFIELTNNPQFVLNSKTSGQLITTGENYSCNEPEWEDYLEARRNDPKDTWYDK